MESTISTEIGRLAINPLGGIIVQRQRSEYSCRTISYAHNSADLVFSSSQFQSQHIQMNGNFNRAILTVGHSFGASSSFLHNVDEIIENIIPNFRDFFRVAVFDNYCDRTTPVSKAEAVEFYRGLINWVIDKPILLVIKSKKSKYGVGRYIPSEELDFLIKNRKIVILDHLGSLLPLCVSNSCQLTVGINISSAGLEANIAGRPSLHFFPGNEIYHPFTREHNNEIVFDSVKMLVERCDYYYRRDKNEILPVPTSVDAYGGDGQGPRRANKVLKFLFNKAKPLDILNNKAALANLILESRPHAD